MNKQIFVRTVRSGDGLHILEIRNSDDVREHFRNTEKVRIGEHDQWFADQLKPENRKKFFVAVVDNKILGYIRYDLNDNCYNISIAVERRSRALGIGSILLADSLSKIQRYGKPIKAGIKKSNLPSQAFFKKNNFNYLYEDDKYIYFLWSSATSPIVIAASHVWDRNALTKFVKRIDRKVVFLQNKDQIERRQLERLNPAFIFFPHWSWVIPEDVWQNYRCIVFHMTDLPFGRGGSPLQNLIIKRYLKTKISAIAVNSIIDGGPIYLKHNLSLAGSAQQIYKRAFKMILFMTGKIIKEMPNPKKQVGKVISFKRRALNQSKLPEIGPLRRLYDFIRMLDAEGYPRAFLDHGDFLMTLSKAKFRSGNISASVTIQKKDYEKN